MKFSLNGIQNYGGDDQFQFLMHLYICTLKPAHPSDFHPHYCKLQSNLSNAKTP